MWKHMYTYMFFVTRHDKNVSKWDRSKMSSTITQTMIPGQSLKQYAHQHLHSLALLSCPLSWQSPETLWFPQFWEFWYYWRELQNHVDSLNYKFKSSNLCSSLNILLLCFPLAALPKLSHVLQVPYSNTSAFILRQYYCLNSKHTPTYTQNSHPQLPSLPPFRLYSHPSPPFPLVLKVS